MSHPRADPARDLHILPKLRDSLSYHYVEHCIIDQDDKSIAAHDANGKTPIPCASLTLLMLGPGTRITHAAIRTLALNGCLVAWTGEQGVRFYAQGTGETRDSRRLLHQARLVSHMRLRMRVVKRMYQMRFPEELSPHLTLQQIRGKEGLRVRKAYADASRRSGVEWTGRAYFTERWSYADPVNRALSAANSCLYGICHAAIVSLGYSPALGFVHTGHVLSFVYDVADLYKLELTVPVAFDAVAESEGNLESRVRRMCRDTFHRTHLLDRIVPDLQHALMVEEGESIDDDVPLSPHAEDAPGFGLWDPRQGAVAAGVNHAMSAEIARDDGDGQAL